MLNLTKAYLYRMLRTKAAWVCMLILVGMTALSISVSYMETKLMSSLRENAGAEIVTEEDPEGSQGNILDEYMGIIQNGFNVMIFGIFTAVFYNSDEKHGYIKNLVTQYSRRSGILLPRMLSLGAYVLGVSLLNFILSAILLKCFYPDMPLGLKGAAFGYMGMHFLLLLTILMIVLFIATLARGTALAVAYSVCASMNMAGLLALPLNFLARRFLHIQKPNVAKYFLETYLFNVQGAEHVWSLVLLLVCYAGAAALLSCLLLDQRDVR